jgi:hypothetical protein
MEPSRDSPSKSANICELRLSIENHASDLLHDGIPLVQMRTRIRGATSDEPQGCAICPSLWRDNPSQAAL